MKVIKHWTTGNKRKGIVNRILTMGRVSIACLSFVSRLLDQFSF